jgi:hypothetical protein
MSSLTKTRDLEHGHSYPIGATASRRGVNVSLFFRAAAGVDLWFVWP